MADRDYEQGYRDGEANREADIRIAVQYARSLDDLLDRLRKITGDDDLELGSEFAGELLLGGDRREDRALHAQEPGQ